MNIIIANAMSGYIETLYYSNIKLIKLCGLDYYNNYQDGCKILLNIIQDIPRLVPYSFDIKSQKIIYNCKDGLLEFQNEIEYLREKYDEILRDNKEFLDNIRKIRNKYEHKIHNVEYKSSGSDLEGHFDYTFKINNNHINISATELIQLFKQLNDLFSNIVYDIKVCAKKNNLHDHPYYAKISRFNFKDFNKIYNCNLLAEIGRILYNF